jgi:hypothetical protein
MRVLSGKTCVSGRGALGMSTRGLVRFGGLSPLAWVVTAYPPSRVSLWRITRGGDGKTERLPARSPGSRRRIVSSVGDP